MLVTQTADDDSSAVTRLEWFRVILTPLTVTVMSALVTAIIAWGQLDSSKRIADAQIRSAEKIAESQMANARERAARDQELERLITILEGSTACQKVKNTFNAGPEAYNAIKRAIPNFWLLIGPNYLDVICNGPTICGELRQIELQF